MQKNNKNLIIFSGGGTAGPVTPLIAVADELSSSAISGESIEGRDYRNKFSFLWVGTKNGPEKRIVEERGIEFKSISAGKLRRYKSIKNIIGPFFVVLGFFQSINLIIKRKPSLVMSAGGFVSVPLIWAAWLFRVPVIIHQQDIRAGLANKLMAPCARVVTVTFKKSLEDYKKKGIWVGNPVRKEFKQRNFSTEEAFKEFKIPKDSKVLLIMGGGTGSKVINEFVINNIGKLTRNHYIIHLTGKGKASNPLNNEKYKQYDFLDIDKIRKAYDISDIVVARCGIGSLTELSILGKISILIPIPDSHQEDNAEIFFKNKAAIVIDQYEIEIEEFIKKLDKLTNDFELRSKLRNNIKEIMKKDASESLVALINKII